MYFTVGLKTFIDISTYCNAGCPKCHRTDVNGLGKIDWLPLVQWDLETFKNAYKLEDNPYLYDVFEICGTWGDPLMNKDLMPIVKYIIDNSKAKIIIDTNGSIRDEEWWWNLGCIGGRRLTVVFAIDGTTQEMHAHYRRNTDLKKILNNLKSLSSTMARASVHTIVFKHNEDHLDDIAEMSKKYGAKQINYTPSNRAFDVDDKFKFTDSKGIKQFLEKSYKYTKRINNAYKM